MFVEELFIVLSFRRSIQLASFPGLLCLLLLMHDQAQHIVRDQKLYGEKAYRNEAAFSNTVS